MTEHIEYGSIRAQGNFFTTMQRLAPLHTQNSPACGRFRQLRVRPLRCERMVPVKVSFALYETAFDTKQYWNHNSLTRTGR